MCIFWEEVGYDNVVVVFFFVFFLFFYCCCFFNTGADDIIKLLQRKSPSPASLAQDVTQGYL